MTIFMKSVMYSIAGAILAIVLVIGLMRKISAQSGLGMLHATVSETNSQIIERIQSLQNADTQGMISTETIGNSVNGQPIEAITLGDDSARPCMVVIGRQHADEPAPTEAQLEIIPQLTSDPQLQSLLKAVRVILIPNANPDGIDLFAATGIIGGSARPNARGINLNRDWQAQSQPETLAIAAFIAEKQPLLVLDQHEDYPFESGKGRYIQAGASLNNSQARATAAIMAAIRAQAVRQGIGLHLAANGRDRDLAMCYFASRGIPSVLIESQQSGLGKNMVARTAVHRSAILGALRLLAKWHPATSETGQF